MKNKDINPTIGAKKNNKYKKLLARLVGRFFNVAMVALFLVVFFIAYSFVLKPKYDKVSTVIAERNELKLENQTVLENNLSTINRYKDAYKKIDADKLSKINTILPPFKTREEFFTLFEEMILKKGYLITSLSVTSDADNADSGTKKKKTVDEVKPGTGPQIGAINIKVSIIGTDYEGMKKLLELIENNLRIMDINNIAYSYGGETLTLDITTYYLR